MHSRARVDARDDGSDGVESRGDKPVSRTPGAWKPPDGRGADRRPPPPGRPGAPVPPGNKDPEDPEDCWPSPPGPGSGPTPVRPGSGPTPIRAGPALAPIRPAPDDGSAAGVPDRPARSPLVPVIQLPAQLLPENMPSQPGVIGIEPGGGIGVSELPPPTVVPIIVAPPLAIPGGAAARGLSTEPVPGPPGGSAAAPPAGRRAAPAQTGSNASSPPSSYRAGYADYLRSAGISEMAAVAAPGLAGIVILTGLGGLVGYRQAKSGRAIRTGGTGRFVD